MTALAVLRTPRRTAGEVDDQALGRRFAAVAVAAVLLLGLVVACTPAEVDQGPRELVPTVLPTVPAPAVTLAAPTPPAVPR